MVGEPDPIGDIPQWYFESNWLTIIVSYALIVGRLLFYDRTKVLDNTFPYVIVFSTAIPIAIVSGLSRFKSFRLDFE